MNEQKVYNYNRVRVDKDDDLLWVKNIMNDLQNEKKIAPYEWKLLRSSLTF